MPSNILPTLRSLLFLGVTALPLTAATDRPNILWLVSEDNGTQLGAYGDANAQTPNLDRLAGEGIRYTNAFANAPVCAVARSSWIFGTPASSLGTVHMRSNYRVPRDLFTTYPELLREAGYYVTNNSKTDYNTRSIDENVIWNQSSPKAHYRNRPEGSPFLAVFNIFHSHESQIFPEKHVDALRVPASDIRIPPYQIATPEVINDHRQYYERLEAMDNQVGQLLAELEESENAENTIVVYCSDHAGVTLRSKRFLHDSGVRVPLIVYFPEKWRHLAPAEPGSVIDRLVQFIDMPKTWLSLAGAEIPSHMPGHIFLGEDISPGPESVFLFSSRFDEAPDTSRAVTDGRWKYIRNFESDRPRFQMLGYPLQQKGQTSQWEAYEQGKLNPTQAAQYRPQPKEELYDTQMDPHEVNNLAASEPTVLAAMRQRLDRAILESRDLGFIPEPMMSRVDESGEATIFEFGQSETNYPLSDVLRLAHLAAEQDRVHLPVFEQALQATNPILRYWAAVGLRALEAEAAGAEPALEQALKDPESSVRITAATALGRMGRRAEMGRFLVGEAQKAETDIGALWALDGLKLMDLPEAIDGLSMEKFTKGQYSARAFRTLSAGGSAWRKPR